jgi:hypothetical protein
MDNRITHTLNTHNPIYNKKLKKWMNVQIKVVRQLNNCQNKFTLNKKRHAIGKQS